MERRDELEQDRAQLQAIIDDLKTGELHLERGQDEYVASLELRIAEIDEKLARKPRPNERPAGRNFRRV